MTTPRHGTLAHYRQRVADLARENIERHSAMMAANRAKDLSDMAARIAGDHARQVERDMLAMEGDLTACRARCDELAGQLMAAQRRHARTREVLAYTRGRLLQTRLARDEHRASVVLATNAADYWRDSAATLTRQRDRAKRSLTALRAAHEDARRTSRRLMTVMGALLALSTLAHAISLWGTP